MASAAQAWTEGLPARRLQQARDAELPASDVWPLTIPAVAQVLGRRARPRALHRARRRERLGQVDPRRGARDGRGHERRGRVDRRHPPHPRERVAAARVAHRGARPRGAAVGLLRAGRDDARPVHLARHQPRAGSATPPSTRMSHGESFVSLLGTRRFRGEGLFVMDEPEAGLSFSAQLHLVAELAEMARRAAHPGRARHPLTGARRHPRGDRCSSWASTASGRRPGTTSRW